MSSLERRKILITGGTSGIGFAIAKDLSSDYDLALLYRNNHNRAKSAADEIKKINPQAQIYLFSADLRDSQETQKMYQKLKSDWGAPDGLINSAGQASSELFLLEEMERFQELIEINYLAVIKLIKIVVPDLIRKKSGHIINISSCTAGVAIEGHSAYAASKAALEKFTLILAGELARYQVSANIVRPGVVLTPLSEDWFQKIISDPKKLENVLGPTKKTIEFQEINRAVRFLLESRQVTGAVIDVDGGQNRFVRY